MQANVGRGADAHRLALQLAYKNNIDVLVIQEPWTLRDLSAKRSVTCPSFMIFSSLSNWCTRPKVLTYVPKMQGLHQ